MFQSSEDSEGINSIIYDGSYDENDDIIINDEEDLIRIIPPEEEDTSDFIKSRYILGIMGFLGIANVYAMRVNLSVAIVAMVNSSAILPPPDVIEECSYNSTIAPVPERDGEFNWDEKAQGIVLGSFFYGYVLTQIPGGRFAELFGGKLVFGIGVLITAIFTLLTPIAARINFSLFILVRVLEGVGEGVTFPSMHAMLARWIPPVERSKFAAIVYAGSNFGTVVSLPISGLLCSMDDGRGWPWAFYIFGGLGIVWFFFWLILVYDTPLKHPRIDHQEKQYILASIGPQENTAAPIPWKHFLTCVPLWAILITQCGQSWAFYTQLTELPTYMRNILHFSIQQVAVFSAIPYLTSWIAGIMFSIIADWFLLKGCISPATSYKIFNSLASVIPSLGLLGVAWAGCDRVIVQWMLGISGAFTGAVYAGNQMNHIALSPQFAGTMYGITNAASNTCGFLAPYVISLIIQGQETVGQWRMVFYIAAGINIGTNLFYVMFASAKEQPWSRPQPQSPSLAS